ncbi:prenyl protein protease [Aspergillus campestris IBT 28561]|uniref:intramembrane prenyl-peptidase Rce1 n=1 Tax=Aspergillus campestris (strain IBT 28561) TaxID=1392248 RepID=A0A2I1D857_ASPC2|nr:prenyl protein protease [Aspergillus campestris IBT 28561]PKY06063.1 prenyl protein protease [Aspergillus campestris IBT 28561]
METYVEPAFAAQTAAVFSAALILVYVAPFYLSSATRPSQTLSRDTPSVIRARIRAVTLSCIISVIAVLGLLIQNDVTVPEAMHLLGWWPIGLAEVLCTLLLTAILFVGPLFERVAEGEWKHGSPVGRIYESLNSWAGWRNYVAGPVTEEIIFRSAIIPLHLLANVSPGRIVFVAPLYFGIAHVHHFYEFRLTHPDTSVFIALFRSIFQFGFTTVFGWYATFVYLRTGSLLAVIIAHSFCNWCGLPRLWGRLDAMVQMESLQGPVYVYRPLAMGWTVAYYLLLVGGAIGFYYGLWPLTESAHALALFAN